jgi:DNA-damage-inducible protein D
VTGIDRYTDSPFDAIRRVRPDGVEFWSARDLMPLLGYGADWRNFTSAIERASVTAQNQGQDVHTLFVGVTEKSIGRPREDFHLTRYACYLVAMNGDPRKSEVAAAQSYFAIKTREAETVAAPREMTRLELIDMARESEVARIEAVERAEQSEAVVIELTPKARAWEVTASSKDDMTVGDAAKAISRSGVTIGRNRLFAWMSDRRWIYRDARDRWTAYQQHIDNGRLTHRVQTYTNEISGEVHISHTVYVTAKGVEDLIARISPTMEVAR